MVEVFKTNVSNVNEAENLLKSLRLKLTLFKINFDLEDCDRILRIEHFGESMSALVIDFLTVRGYCCIELE